MWIWVTNFSWGPTVVMKFWKIIITPPPPGPRASQASLLAVSFCGSRLFLVLTYTEDNSSFGIPVSHAGVFCWPSSLGWALSFSTDFPVLHLIQLSEERLKVTRVDKYPYCETCLWHLLISQSSLGTFIFWFLQILYFLTSSVNYYSFNFKIYLPFGCFPQDGHKYLTASSWWIL